MAVAVRSAPPAEPLVLEPDAKPVVLEPIVEARAVDKVYDTGKLQVHALREVELHRRPRRDGGDHGPERLRQDDLAQLPLRASTPIDDGDVLIDGVALSEMSRPTSAPTTARAGWASSFSSTT